MSRIKNEVQENVIKYAKSEHKIAVLNLLSEGASLAKGLRMRLGTVTPLDAVDTHIHYTLASTITQSCSGSICSNSIQIQTR